MLFTLHKAATQGTPTSRKSGSNALHRPIYFRKGPEGVTFCVVASPRATHGTTSTSGSPFCQEASKGLFSFFGRPCHSFKKDSRPLYRPRPTGTINLPYP